MSKEGGGRESSSSSRGRVEKLSEEEVAEEETKIHSGGGDQVVTSNTEIPHQLRQPQSQAASRFPIQEEAVAAQSVASIPGSQPSEVHREEETPRQVIAVSASKGPAAFFNLARKFLASDEMCDLSALEGAIVSAVDAAHLLERSKLATIVRIQTSYVAVEPKRKKLTQPSQPQVALPVGDATSAQFSSSVQARSSTPQAASTEAIKQLKKTPSVARKLSSQQRDSIESKPHQGTIEQPSSGRSKKSKGSSKGAEMRRSRIIITVKRTEDYKKWLEENPTHDIPGGDDDDDPEHAADIGSSHPRGR